MKFHAYGLIIGVALLIGCWLSSLKAQKYHFSEAKFEGALWWAMGGGFLFARLWHVMTDYELYNHNWLAAFAVWQGGMSIIGGLVGAVLALYVYSRQQETTKYMWQFVDLAVFGLPAAQAIGRLGNYVNHELYGLPTQLPWGIFIPTNYRTAEFATQNYFHPLFAYEMIALLAFAGTIWVLDARKFNLKIGTGLLAVTYSMYYCGIRFGLDFLRIDRGPVVMGLGFNQLFLLLTIVGLSSVVWKYGKQK